ncbi:hypothetical protein KA119_02210 [Candidatus Gracilibacteria bacterium]|nr:hypothetical protein [Candidatus Gracilibacteria bacterium]
MIIPNRLIYQEVPQRNPEAIPNAHNAQARNNLSESILNSKDEIKEAYKAAAQSLFVRFEREFNEKDDRGRAQAYDKIAKQIDQYVDANEDLEVTTRNLGKFINRLRAVIALRAAYKRQAPKDQNGDDIQTYDSYDVYTAVEEYVHRVPLGHPSMFILTPELVLQGTYPSTMTLENDPRWLNSNEKKAYFKARFHEITRGLDFNFNPYQLGSGGVTYNHQFAEFMLSSLKSHENFDKITAGQAMDILRLFADQAEVAAPLYPDTYNTENAWPLIKVILENAG